jgi:hypothetical protein
MHVSTLRQLQEAFAEVDRSQLLPPNATRARRGKTAGFQIVSLPEGYLDHLDDDVPPCGADDSHASGG